MTTSHKGRIFISYRRLDTSYAAGRIYDRLAAHFGEKAIFMDVEAIEGGLDFVEVLEEAVQSCDVLIALIGRQWLNTKDEAGNPRLENPEDFVRIEIAAALKRDIRVIPVLVDGTNMPRSTELPENLQLLARRNALQVNHQSFNADVNRLIAHIKLALRAAEESKIMNAQAIKAAREKEKKETVEKAAREKAEREAAEREAGEKAAKEAAQKVVQQRRKEKEEQAIARREKRKQTISKFLTKLNATFMKASPIFERAFWAKRWKALFFLISAFLLLMLGYGFYIQLASPPMLFLCFSQSQTRVCEYTGSEEDVQAMYVYGDMIHWSPVTDRSGDIYFTSDRDGKAEIYRLKRDGTVEQVTHTPGSYKSWSPVVGPDGKIYFVSNRNGKTEIYQLERGGGVLRITNTPGRYESWSPAVSLDGSLFFTTNRDGKAEIYRFKSGKAERVTYTPGGDRSWSPALARNGDLYFTSDRDGKSEIYRLNHAGGVDRVTDTPRNFGSWSPVVRGDQIFFTSNRSGKREVFLLGSKSLAISRLESWTNISEISPLY